MSTIAYHLTPAAWFQARPSQQPYLAASFAQEGFIHLTLGIERVIEVGNRYYRDQPGEWLLLTVDLDRVAAEVRFDDPQRVYPHVYGPIDNAAIAAVHAVLREPNGWFTGIGPQRIAPGSGEEIGERCAQN